MGRDFKIGDRVRVVGYFENGHKPVGIIERFDGAYVYVHTPVKDETEKDRCVLENYDHELIHVSDAEYFKLLLKGENIRG
jgi:hypothetical protein